MVASGTILIIVVFLIALWVISKIIPFKHKLLTIFLIALIILGYFSFTAAFKGQEVNLTDFKGLMEASTVYFSWIGSAFGNAQMLTSRVVANNSQDERLE
jgi:4-amino-4-deoxy-L-arabinose transferase-like glycosyltransferase